MPTIPVSEIDDYIDAADQWIDALKDYRAGLTEETVDIGSNPPPPPPPPPGSA